MRVKTLLGLTSALCITAAATSAAAQFGQPQPAQPPPAQLPPAQPPPAQLPPAQPVQPAQPGFGQPTQPAQPGFGQPTQPAQPGFGQPTQPAQPGFGQPTQPAQPGFGQPPPTQPGFGAPTQPGFGQPGQPGVGQPGYGYVPPSNTPKKSTALEIATLYTTATAWGIGTGIWIDALAETKDPGISVIAPIIFGVAAPTAVFFLDRPPMREGLPSSIAVGLLVGAAEGLGIASYQAVTSYPGSFSGFDMKGDGTPLGTPPRYTSDTGWGFKGLTTSVWVGATIGGVGGFAYGYFLKPHPKANLLIASGVLWGTIIGSQFGWGASRLRDTRSFTIPVLDPVTQTVIPGPKQTFSSKTTWSQTNDSVALGGLIGFNIALVGVAGLSVAWHPSWEQIGWMWGGFAIGEAASALVYPFYAIGPADPRRGLIFQAVAGTLGIGIGALVGRPDNPNAIVKNEREERTAREEEDRYKHARFFRVVGGGLLPVESGAGASVLGVW